MSSSETFRLLDVCLSDEAAVPDWTSSRQRSDLRGAIPVFGLQHHQAHHHRYQTDGRDDQGEDDGRRRVAELLCGAFLEELGMDVHKRLLHQWIGPRDPETVGYALCAEAQVAVQAADEQNATRERDTIFTQQTDNQYIYLFTLAQTHQSVPFSDIIVELNSFRHMC